MRKPAFCICKNKDPDQLRGDCEADQRFVFATRLVQFLYFLNLKFQASCNLLWLYSPVCVGPGQKPRRPVFSQRGSFKVLVGMFFFCMRKKDQISYAHLMFSLLREYCSSVDPRMVMLGKYSKQSSYKPGHEKTCHLGF